MYFIEKRKSLFSICFGAFWLNIGSKLRAVQPPLESEIFHLCFFYAFVLDTDNVKSVVNWGVCNSKCATQQPYSLIWLWPQYQCPNSTSSNADHPIHVFLCSSLFLTLPARIVKIPIFTIFLSIMWRGEKLESLYIFFFQPLLAMLSTESYRGRGLPVFLRPPLPVLFDVLDYFYCSTPSMRYISWGMGFPFFPNLMFPRGLFESDVDPTYGGA